MPNPRWTHDRKLTQSLIGIVGVDEAGRGCLAGPVVAGAVILPAIFFTCAKNRKLTEEMNDSKHFDEIKREELFAQILELADKKVLYGSTGIASVEEIEEHNIVGATCIAMQRAMDQVSAKSDWLWKPVKKISLELFDKTQDPAKDWEVMVDGRPMKKLPYKHEGLVRGDTKSLAIAMASMLAKVNRDRLMRELHQQFPSFGFDSNKGYGTPVHLHALKEKGPTEHHRPRFLRNLISESRVTSVENEQSQLSFW